MRRAVVLLWMLALGLALEYTVAPGDTLFSLSRRFGVSVERIRELNGLKGDLIRVGERLYLPDPERPDFAALVRPYLGAPYRFGGTGPGGFDCSGLVGAVYARLGVRLPRTAAAMYRALPPAGALLPGDLVFFSFSGGRVDHVGIYLGGGRFVHASTRGVVIEPLAAPWYQRVFLGARRVIRYDGANERTQDHPAGAPPR